MAKRKKPGFLDWFMSPGVLVGPVSTEEVKAFNELTREYWRQVDERNNPPKKEVHNHVHMHLSGSDDELERVENEIKALEAYKLTLKKAKTAIEQ